MSLKIFIDAIKLDPINCNYSFLNKKMGPVLIRDKRITNRGIILNIILFSKNFIKEVFNFRNYKNRKKNSNITSYINSTNQYFIGKDIIDNTDIYYSRVKMGSGVKFPIAYAYIISLLYIPLLIGNYFNLNKQEKKRYINKLDYNLLMYGQYVICRFMFKKYDKLILFNDHEMWTRVAKIAAEDELVTTIYIQHASVNKKFPFLDFDIAFLDGNYSRDTYEEIGVATKTKVYLVGSPKYDIYKRRSEGYIDSTETLLLCINLKDELDLIDDFLEKESSKYNSIIFRPHPSDKRNWSHLISKYSLHKSNNEEIHNDLMVCTRQVASESNVHLDSVVMGVMTYYVNFTSSDIQDHYDFIKNGLLTIYGEEEKYSTEQIDNALKYYLHSIGESYEGRVAEHIKQFIDEENIYE